MIDTKLGWGEGWRGAGEGGWGLRRRGWPDKFDFRPFSYHLTALKLDQTRAGYLNLILRQGTFLIGGVGRGFGGERSLVNIFQIGEGQTCVIRNRSRVAVFFGKKKITSCRLVDSFLLTNTRSA